MRERQVKVGTERRNIRGWGICGGKLESDVVWWQRLREY